MKVREFHALSLNREDQDLIKKAGLKNIGLLGYLNHKQIPGTLPLIHYYLKYSSGPDYFYTVNPSKEKLDKLNPVDHGPIGYVATKNTTGFIQLHRYYHAKHQTHIYVTNPNLNLLLADGYRDESDSNPLFIQQAGSDDATPLYLYSNAEATYFSQLPSSPSRSRFPNELVMELLNILETLDVPSSKFQVSYEGTTSVTISLTDTVLSFYVNQQANGVYYTVRRNPEPNDEAYIIHDIDNWSGVIDRFHKWLQDVKPFLENQTTTTTTASTTTGDKETITKRIYGHVDIAIQDGADIEPAFKVVELASQIVSIIKNLKAEPGNMVGIFGPWGRGKTYLMDKIWEKLSSDLNTEYIQIKYPAWKYQHTPANWAYLYEQFSEKFLGKPRLGILHRFKYHRNLLKLSWEREGSYPLIAAITVGLAIFLGTLFIFDYEGFFQMLFGFIGIPLGAALVVTLIKQLKLDHFTKAFNLIKKYNTKVSFKESLGVQAEIQKELTHLIKVMTSHSKGSKSKKLVLFVDDLDRCNEVKVIELIDSLRIILDDDELKDKLLVLTALDERILNLAVINKYDHVHKKFDHNELAREYIDKLFIFSIKLTGLTPLDSREFFENFTKQEFVGEALPRPSDQPEGIINPEKKEDTEVSEQIQNGANPSAEKQRKMPNVVTKLTLEEKEIFKRKLQLLSSPTPRKIKIIYYRYLFIKNLLIPAFSQQENGYWFQDNTHEILIERLIHFSQQPIGDLIIEYKKVSESESEEISLHNFTVDQTEYMKLLKVFELAIAY